METGIAAPREHSEQMFSVEAGFLGKLTTSSMDLSHIADSEEECSFIFVLQAGIQVANGVF